MLEQIVKKIPAPTGDKDAPLKALIFDATYDSYKGVIIFCRLREGSVKVGDTIKMMATGASDVVTEVGYFGAGQFIPCDELSAGMVGYIAASIKNVRDTRVGDTVTLVDRPCDEALPGYKKVNPMVYCGLYPADSAKYPDLRDALEKLHYSLSLRHHWHLALASDADSLVFYIWKLFRRDWRESLILISLPLHLVLFTRFTRQAVR